MDENVIEWLNGSDYIGVTLSQKKWINKVELFATQDENVRILARNADGSIFAHLPISYLKLSKKRRVQLSNEEREAMAERMRKMRQGGNQIDS